MLHIPLFIVCERKDKEDRPKGNRASELMFVGRLRKYILYLLWLPVNGSETTMCQSSKLGSLVRIA